MSDCVISAVLLSPPEKLNWFHTLDESKVELLLVAVTSTDVVQLCPHCVIRRLRIMAEKKKLAARRELSLQEKVSQYNKRK